MGDRDRDRDREGERDVRVIYKTRPLSKDDPRPRIPTALDPYDNPYAAEPLHRRKYSARDSASSLGDGSSATTEVARSTHRTGTLYPAREDERTRSSYINSRRSTGNDYPQSSEDLSARKSVVVDQRRDGPPPRRSDSTTAVRSNRERDYTDLDVDELRGRGRDYYMDDRPRPAGSPYVIETRQGDIIDITVPGKRSDRAYDKDIRRSVYNETASSRRSGYERGYDRDYDKAPHMRPNGDTRGGNNITVIGGGGGGQDYPPTPVRRTYEEYRPSPSSGRAYDYERDDEWRLVDSMKDTRIASVQPRDTHVDTQARSRAQTYSSEDSYVMVSPTKATSRHREASSSRSAIARSDYPEHELHRRRSRSISFRESQVHAHDASERRHERPGAEAEICGQYLRGSQPDHNPEYRSDTYGSLHGRDSRSRGRDRESYASTYHERDEPYGPQIGYEPKKRERSRHRRNREDDVDDRSYYSENITKKTTTRYE